MPVPPNIAIICNSLPPYRVHFHLRIVRELPQVRLWTICTHEATDYRWKFDPPDEINTVSFGLEPGVPDRHAMNLASFRKGGRIIRWMRDHDIRAVVLNGWSDAARLRVIRWCHRRGIPCFVFSDSNIKGDTLTGGRATFKRILVRWVVRNTTGQFPCGSLGQAFFEKYGATARRIYYVPYEPDYDQLRQMSAEQINQVLARFGLARNRRRIVFSGRLIDAKRPDLLLEAFCQIAPQRQDWELVVAGDGELRDRLKSILPSGFAGRVFWTGFIHDQADLSALYRGSDVLALPSSYEPWALVINEAAAAGMAIVSSDVVGAAAELVRDGVNGRIFPSGDLAGLVQCLLDVTDPQRIDSMKTASLEVLQEWRERADPVAKLRRALSDAGVLKET